MTNSTNMSLIHVAMHNTCTFKI